jgi:hypothetical protein
MKTAVEWLIEEYFGGIENCTPNFRKHINQAKEMEKQQIIDAHIHGGEPDWDGVQLQAEQYYNETYKNTNK